MKTPSDSTNAAALSIFRGSRSVVKLFLFAGFGSLLTIGNSLEAAIVVVNSLSDNGNGSLRQALSTANPGDTIQIVAQGTLFLSSGNLTVNKNLSVAGSGVDKFVINAQQLSYHFLITSNAAVTVSDLTLTNGYNQVNSPEGQGGAVRNFGSLALTRCAVLDSSSEFGTGGGIYNEGRLMLQQCVIGGNIALDGGGISNNRETGSLQMNACTVTDNAAGFGDGGGIVNSGTALVTNSTISRNFAAFDGGGIGNFGLLNLQSCTVASNLIVIGFDGVGGGCFNHQQATLSSRNTIFAGNLSEHEGVDIAGTLTSEGYNLIQNASGWNAVGNTSGNIVGREAKIGPLQNNGGPTGTHALLEGSPAIDRGSSGFFSDQRGFSRPYDTVQIANATDGSDIGAHEFQPAIFLPFESESGVLTAPIVAASDILASEGRYVVSASANGSASYNLNIPEPDNYVIWCRVLAPDFNSDSFFVSADGGAELIYDVAENILSGLWQWTRIIGRTTGNPVNFNPRLFAFAKGNHTLLFRARDPNTKFDRFLITNDTNFVPVISLEAESAGLTSPAAIASDAAASRGQYIASPIAEQGSASFAFGIPATNSYFVWCRVLAPEANADSFYVSMDGGAELIYDVAENGHSPFWQWTRLIGRTNNGPINSMPRTFSLGQSQHTLVFRTREANSKLDRILITNDPKLNPAAAIDRFPSGILQVKFFDESARTNRIQTTATLNPVIWNETATRVADWNGFFIFQETTTSPSRFYRSVAP